MAVPRRQSSHHRAWSVSSAARSRRQCVAVSSQGADTCGKKTIKTVTMGTVSNNIETSRLSYYTCPHSFTPQALKGAYPTAMRPRLHQIIGTSRQHSAARRGNGANRKTRHNNTVTSRQYGRRAIYVSGDVRFQVSDTFYVGKTGGTRYQFSVLRLITPNSPILG